MAAALPRRALGRTGEQVSFLGVGGFHLGLAGSEAEAIRIVRTAVDEGATFLDNCWDYRIVKERIATAEECLRYAMSLPVSVVITGCESVERLEQALRIARAFRPLEATEEDAILARTARAARGGANELYETTGQYDGTSQNPRWLG